MHAHVHEHVHVPRSMFMCYVHDMYTCLCLCIASPGIRARQPNRITAHSHKFHAVPPRQL